MRIDTPSSFGRIPERDTLRALIGWVGSAFVRWRVRARTRRRDAELLAMPDHTLRDIGVSRIDLQYPPADVVLWRRIGW